MPKLLVLAPELCSAEVRGSPGGFLTKGNRYFVGRLQGTLPMPIRDVFAVVFLLDSSAHALMDFVFYINNFFSSFD